MLQALLIAPVALLVRHIFNVALPQHDESGAVWSSLAVLGLTLGSTLVGLVTRVLVLRAVNHSVANLRAAVWKRLHELPMRAFQQTSTSSLHTLLVQDTERVGLLAGQAIATTLPAGVVAIGLSCVAVLLDPLLTVSLLVVIPALVLVSNRLKRAVKRRVLKWQTHFDRFSEEATESLRTIVMVQLLGNREAALAGRLTTVTTLRDASVEVAAAMGVWNVAQQAVAVTAGSAVLVIGGAEVISGRLSTGDLFAFYAVAALLLRNVGAIAAAVPVLTALRPCLERIGKLVAAPPEPHYTGTAKHHFRGGLELRDVSFSYADRPVLTNINLRIEPGERVAIVGPNGAGKSTLGNLLLGLYQPDSGTVLADGRPFDALDMDLLRPQMGVMLQDHFLGSGSIRDQVLASRAGDDADLWRALTLAGADEFVRRLDAGLDTQVGDVAKWLSGGQRQRLALARMLLTEPALILLDEPSAHVDDAGVRLLIDTLSALPGRPTVIMVTHDPVLARVAERIIEFRDGRIVRDSPQSALAAHP